MFDKFAEELKAKREQKGLTLQQVAQKTKIDLRFLEVMEEGDFSFLPELYVRAFLKNYANVVGFDENTVIKKYEAAKAGKSFEDTELQSSETAGMPVKGKDKPKDLFKAKTTESGSVRAPRLQNKQRYLFIAVAGVIFFLIALYYFLSRTDNEIIVSEKPLSEILEENQQRYIEEEANPGNPENLNFSSDSLNLNIVSSETSWVKIIYDDRNTGEFILLPMSQKNVRAAGNFKVTFGNARGITLKLNGKDLTFDNKRTVAHIIIDSSGLRYISTQPNVQR